MTATQNKVYYGLKNIFWFGVTETFDQSTGKTTSSYTTPAPWKGGVSFTGTPQGAKTVFRADDMNFFVANGNGGYSGDMVTARIPDEVREFLGFEKRDADGIGYETGDSGTEEKYIGLLFQFAADQKAIRHGFLRCSLTRPAISGETTPEGDAPNVKGETTTVTITPRPDDDHLLHIFADPRTDVAKYNAWFNAVQLPNTGTVEPVYVYTAVSPVGTENPKTEGWYVLQGDTYVPTNDTTVDENKTYYERTEQE